MKKILFVLVFCILVAGVGEASANLFAKKTDDSTTGSGLFVTKSFNERYPRNTRGY